jgi:hypothetical protein
VAGTFFAGPGLSGAGVGDFLPNCLLPAVVVLTRGVRLGVILFVGVVFEVILLTVSF